MLPLSARPAADAEEQSSWQHPVPIPDPHSPTTHQHATHTREWAPAHPPKSPVSKNITTGGAHRPALSLRLGRQELQPSPSSQDRHLYRVWRRVDQAAISFIAGGFIRGWTATFWPPSPSSSQRFSWLFTVTRWTGSAVMTAFFVARRLACGHGPLSEALRCQNRALVSKVILNWPTGVRLFNKSNDSEPDRLCRAMLSKPLTPCDCCRINLLDKLVSPFSSLVWMPPGEVA